MRYLIHNIYGDADDLIATKPEDVTCIPAGWTPEAEAARNELLASLGLDGVSCLPCLLHYVEAQEVDDEESGPVSIPAHWAEVRIADLPKPWAWEAIEAAI